MKKLLIKTFSVTLLKTRIDIHWSFFLSLLYIALDGHPVHQLVNSKGFLYGLVFALLIHASVLVHEFGHLYTAKAFKIKTHNILMTFLGGAANIEVTRRTKNKTELIIAAAGPMVSVGLGIFFWGLVQLIYTLCGFESNSCTIHKLQTYGVEFLKDLCVINFALAVFNMIPAFPFDGGRILRALLGMKYGRTKATDICIMFSIGFGSLFVIAGLFITAPGMFIIGVVLIGIGWAHKKNLLGEM
jgi:Zn-dependent protease